MKHEIIEMMLKINFEMTKAVYSMNSVCIYRLSFVCLVQEAIPITNNLWRRLTEIEEKEN